MDWRDKAQNIPRHFLFAIIKLREAIEFTQAHKLWRGILSYGWLSKALLGIGIFFGVKYVLNIWEWMQAVDLNDPSTIVMGLGSAQFEFWQENIAPLLSGSYKYIILVLTEVITFHVVRKTLEILTGKQQDKSFNSFIKAQVRMFKIALRSWIKELIATVLIGVALGIFSVEFLKAPLIFIIQCYYLGFAVVDNYHELYDIEVEVSAKKAEQIAGLVLAIGLVFYVLLLIPLIGPLVAPSICGVTAALAMLELERSGELELEVAPTPSG